MALGEQATALAGGLALVPNYVDQDLARQLAQARIGGIQANTQAQQTETRANNAVLDDDQRYQAAVQQYLLRPTPQGAHDLIVQFPKKAEPMKQAWAIRDNQQQKTDLTQMGSVLSLATAGRTDKAADIMRQRIAADTAAGQDTKEDQALLDALESKDPAEQKLAVGIIQMHVAAITGPEHFGSVVESLQKKGGFTLQAGDTRFDDNNQVIAESPYIKGADGTLYANPNAKGGGQASGGGAASPGGPFDPHQFFKDFVLPHEGGYAEHDANGAPVNFGINQAANPGVDVKNLTKDQAADIFATKYAPKAASLPPALAGAYADTAYINPKRADQFLAASGGDPNKFMAMRESWMASLVAKEPDKYQPYAKAWANRNRDLRAYVAGQGGGAPSAGGGLKVIVPGKGKDAPSGFEFTEDGRSLRPIPGGPADPNANGKGALQVPGNPDLGGPEYLTDLSKTNRALANQVQAVLDTRAAYPPATARSPQAQILRAAVLQADPAFDELAYKRRKDTITQYTPGHAGPGASMLSAATLINHVYELAHAARELPDHATRLQNWASSAFANQTNQPWLIKFNEGRKFVASELPKFLEGKAPTEGQVQEHYESYSPSKGKSGIQTALSTDMDYLFGRYQPLIQAYKDQTGKDLNIESYAPGQLTRAKAAALEYYRTNGSLPTVVSTPQQAAKLPHGSVFVTRDGRVLKRK